MEDTIDEPEEEEDDMISDESTPAPRKRGRKPKHGSASTSRGKPGRKPKVPTLKIKFSKRKRSSSVSYKVNYNRHLIFIISNIYDLLPKFP